MKKKIYILLFLIPFLAFSQFPKEFPNGIDTDTIKANAFVNKLFPTIDVVLLGDGSTRGVDTFGKFVNGTDPNDAVYTNGNVGIGTDNPNNASLEIEGTVNDNYIEFSRIFGGNLRTDLTIGVGGSNGFGAIIKGGASFPEPYDLRGFQIYALSANTSAAIYALSNGSSGPAGSFRSNGSGNAGYFYSGWMGNGVVIQTNLGTGLVVNNPLDVNNDLLADFGNDKLKIYRQGIAVGSANAPTAKQEIVNTDPTLPYLRLSSFAGGNGDVFEINELGDVIIQNELVLKSPNGTLYKLSVDDSGNLTTTSY